MERVMLTLPMDLLTALDQQAKQKRTNRSQMVRQVLREWLNQQQRKEFEALLAEEYRAMADESVVVVNDSLSAQSAAAEGGWSWNE